MSSLVFALIIAIITTTSAVLNERQIAAMIARVHRIMRHNRPGEEQIKKE